MSIERDRIAEIFNGKNIFITGGTGFMGKVLIERFLRTTEVNKIFILTRSKRNDTSHERILKLLNNPLFAKLKEKMSIEEILNKIHLINGDCSKVDLDLSDDDRQLIIENVQMIFNFAATVSFNAKFKHAMELNLRSVRDLMKLAKECEHLEIFCHLSTAYCHMSKNIAMEVPYNHELDPNEIIEFIENSTEEEIKTRLSPYLSKSIPSSYALSKSLAEKLIVQMNEHYKIPVVIIRPGIVSPTYSDPIPGWTENFNSFNGFIAASCIGMLKSFYLEKKFCDFNSAPVDFAIGNIMLCLWSYLSEGKSSKVPVYFLKNYPFDPLKCLPNDYERKKNECLIGLLGWYPKMYVTDWRIIHNLRAFLFHTYLGFYQDLVLTFFGYKRTVLDHHRKLVIGMKIFNACNQQRFQYDNINAIGEKLTQKELIDYFGADYDVKKFRLIYLNGLRKYVFKRDDKLSSENSKTFYDLLYIFDMAYKLVCYIILARIIRNILGWLFAYFQFSPLFCMFVCCFVFVIYCFLVCLLVYDN